MGLNRAVCKLNPRHLLVLAFHACALEPSSTVLVFLLCFESLLFGLFTMCMFMDQMWSINLNKTYIDRLKDAQTAAISSSEVSGKNKFKRADCMGGVCAWLLRQSFRHTYERSWETRTRSCGFCQLFRTGTTATSFFGFTMAGSKRAPPETAVPHAQQSRCRGITGGGSGGLRRVQLTCFDSRLVRACPS